MVAKVMKRQQGSVPTSMAAAILACEGCVGHVRGTSLALCLNLQRKHLDNSVCDLNCVAKAEVAKFRARAACIALRLSGMAELR